MKPLALALLCMSALSCAPASLPRRTTQVEQKAEAVPGYGGYRVLADIVVDRKGHGVITVHKNLMRELTRKLYRQALADGYIELDGRRYFIVGGDKQ